jgi:hypothetical protein
MNDTADSYRMNPAEDTLLRGDQLTEGMWVLAELNALRTPAGTSEDDLIRAQRFRQVTGLRRQPGIPELAVFTGTWVDGYQKTHTSGPGTEWIVKKDSIAAADPEAVRDARDLAVMCRDGYARHAESAAALGLSPSVPGPVFDTADGGAFTIMRNGRAYRVTVAPEAGEGQP